MLLKLKNGETVKVRFRYYSNTKDVVVTTYGNILPTIGRTECIVKFKTNEELIFESHCSKSETCFRKNKGRKEAFKKSLMYLYPNNKEIRSDLWKQFFNQCNK